VALFAFSSIRNATPVQHCNCADFAKVAEDWDAEDSEAEREKAKKAEAAKVKAEAEAKAAHKSKTQRIAARIADKKKRQEEDDEETSSEEEDEQEHKARLLKEQKAADLKNAENLFGAIEARQRTPTTKHITIGDDPASSIDLSEQKIFKPETKVGFNKLRDVLVPLIGANSKKAPYNMFMQELAKELCKDLPSEQIKKIASTLTALSNEKMKEEKLAEKGAGKKSKTTKKAVLNANKDMSLKADTSTYDDGLEE
jgi:translation initiation factor 3 subunit J